MILDVYHVTSYRYATPVRSAVQSLRLTPSACEGQTVLHWSVRVEGGVRGGVFRDGAGDEVEGWSVGGPVSEIPVIVTGRIETRDMAGLLGGHRELVPPAAYLRETLPTRADAAMVDLARTAAARARGALDQAHRLSAAVTAAVEYRPGATEAHTTAAEALALAEGVCQDHAQILVGMARHLRMPARYVSGYLFARDDGAPHEAAHAWAEIWVDTLGWIGFDPANACCPDDRYIRLGSGYDARDAAPIRGMANGLAAETLDVAVAISAAQQ
jgi:transglutaminase-like putative cysteine protease